MISWFLPSYLIDSIDIVRYCIFSERFKANKEVEQGPLCGWWASVQVRCVVENKKSNHASCVLTTHDLWMRTRKGNLSSPPIFHRRGLGGAAEWNRLTRTVIPFCVCANVKRRVLYTNYTAIVCLLSFVHKRQETYDGRRWPSSRVFALRAVLHFYDGFAFFFCSKPS